VACPEAEHRENPRIANTPVAGRRTLAERGLQLYLISRIDDASSRLLIRLPRTCACCGATYTDKASLFQTTPKIARDCTEVPRDERQPLPPTQIGRALAELGIVWIAAHSPQAKGRIERSFRTAQDRLVKGLRVAGARTLEQANAYLEAKFIPWWNEKLTVVPASADDAHRPLARDHSLPASLSYVETRQVGNGYTIQFDHKIYQIARSDIRAGLRGAPVRIEARLDGSLAMRFRSHYLVVTECSVRPKAVAVANKLSKSATGPRPKSQWMKNFHLTRQTRPLCPRSSPLLESAAQSSFGRPGKSGPAIVAFSVFKASARESHQSMLASKSKTLGGYPAGPG
jgi:hypothetical protein